MNEPGLTPIDGQSASRPVFVSYATEDRKQALDVCKAIEGRGTRCWISTRDVPPGENYQEAIVRSLRAAPAMVLVFSKAANDSDEIKKELSLASRYRVPVIAIRLEGVEPSDAFAYELSTRQWIDAFEGWEQSIDLLVRRIGELGGASPSATPSPRHGPRQLTSSSVSRRATVLAAAALLLLGVGIGAWWFLAPTPVAAHSMMVRLAGFQLLSADLPATLRDTVDAEITAAFNVVGAVGVSTASAPVPGTAPSYALGGTIQRDGKTIRVITRLSNERSGATVWTDNFNYDGDEASKVPRRIAVDTGNVVRCGLFGASTYHKPLPDAVLKDYMQFCQGHWDPYTLQGRKALIPAQRVVAAAPDFSWGWAGLAGAYWKVANSADTPELTEEARVSGRQAADRAVAIDARNSEALYIKSMLLDRHDWIGREILLKRAVAAQRLDCGCEHHQYGWMLVNVGRIAEALEQLRQADDMLALYVYTPLTLASALVVAGKPNEAKPFYDAAIDLAPDTAFAQRLTVSKAIQTGDTKLLLDPKLPIPEVQRAALLKGYQAMASRDAGEKAQAVQMLLALAEDKQNDAVARMLADLGAEHDALQVAARFAKTHEYPGASLFWHPSMRGVLGDPAFPDLAKQLGLMDYWRETRTRPDVCAANEPPPFCRTI